MAIKSHRHHMHIPTFRHTQDTHNVADFASTPYAKPEAPHADLNFLPKYRPNYMARDYESLRQLLLERLASTLPSDTERSPADFTVMMEEIFAYTGDYLSYFQDSVATEAYLNTARNRISIKRHLSLINYFLHEGCNARVWVNFEVKEPTALPKGTPLLSSTGDSSVCLPLEINRLRPFAQQYDASCFETMYDQSFFPEQNIISIYDWGLRDYVIPTGATAAVLNGHLSSLKAGDILILAELPSNFDTHGRYNTKDALSCQAVRLTDVYHSTRAEPFFPDDAPVAFNMAVPQNVADHPVTCIRWHEDDALNFDLTVVSRDEPLTARAFGNVVLADQGMSISRPVSFNAHYTPEIGALDLSNLVYAQSLDVDSRFSAAQIEKQDPDKALPCLHLQDQLDYWSPVQSLLESGRFDRSFVVDRQDDGLGFIRFGDDTYGQAPNTHHAPTMHYRISTGSAPSIGAHVIQHVVCENNAIIRVSNMISSTHPIKPESAKQACIMAPKSYRRLDTCIKPADYAALAKTYTDIANAVAFPLHDGHGYTMCVYVQQDANFPFDSDLARSLAHKMQPFASVGHRVNILSARYVPVDLTFVIHMKNGASLPYAREALAHVFGNSSSADEHAIFADKSLTFGQPLVLSKLIEKLSQVSGVDYVDLQDPRTVFKRLDDFGSEDRLEAGIIPVKANEIIMMRNAPERPNDGSLRFVLLQKTMTNYDSIHNAEGML